MSILRLKPVLANIKRQLSSRNIHIGEVGRELDTDTVDRGGIRPAVFSIVEAKSGLAVIPGDKLKAGTCYDIVTEDIIIKKVSAKDPILFTEINKELANVCKSYNLPTFIQRGHNGPIVIRVVLLKGMELDDLLDSDVLTLHIFE